jgi:hypothetical protein
VRPWQQKIVSEGADSLAVIMIDVGRFDRLTTPQDQMNYFMGASRVRQLLAILHKTALNRPRLASAFLCRRAVRSIYATKWR